MMGGLMGTVGRLEDNMGSCFPTQNYNNAVEGGDDRLFRRELDVITTTTVFSTIAAVSASAFFSAVGEGTTRSHPFSAVGLTYFTLQPHKRYH